MQTQPVRQEDDQQSIRLVPFRQARVSRRRGRRETVSAPAGSSRDKGKCDPGGGGEEGHGGRNSPASLQGEVKAGLEWVQERLEDSLESVRCMGEGGSLETGRE